MRYAEAVTVYLITPVPAPRMTRSDKWKKRPCVVRYFQFRDECKRLGMTIENGAHITFVLPLPKKCKPLQRDGLPHQQKPDVDNLAKGVFDAIFEDDSHIYDISLRKIWGDVGKIIIENPRDMF